MALRLVGLVYAIAWFVPVVKDGPTLAKGQLPGFEALRFALSPLWGDAKDTPSESLVCVLSGLTNLVFVAGWVRLARNPAASGRRLSWILFGATALNTFWFVDLAPIEELRAGYWIWLASFALLGLVARFRRAAPPPAA